MELLLRLLSRRLGALPLSRKILIRKRDLAKIEALGESLLGSKSRSDLARLLRTNASRTAYFRIIDRFRESWRLSNTSSPSSCKVTNQFIGNWTLDQTTSGPGQPYRAASVRAGQGTPVRLQLAGLPLRHQDLHGDVTLKNGERAVHVRPNRLVAEPRDLAIGTLPQQYGRPCPPQFYFRHLRFG